MNNQFKTLTRFTESKKICKVGVLTNLLLIVCGVIEYQKTAHCFIKEYDFCEHCQMFFSSSSSITMILNDKTNFDHFL